MIIGFTVYQAWQCPSSVVLLNSSWRSSTNHFIPWILSIIVPWLAVCILPTLIKRFSSVVLIFKLLIIHWLASSAHSSDYLPFNTIVVNFTSSSFNHHFFIPPRWSEYCLFFLLKVHCIAPRWSTFQGVSRRVDVISIRDFANSVNVLESNLIFQRSCLFKSNCWNEIREMLVLEKIFWKSSFFDQRSNIHYSM